MKHKSSRQPSDAFPDPHPKQPAKPGCAPARGSALANRIADALMEGWQGFHASRLQLRGPEEQDMGGLCREAVIRVIDEVLEAPNAEVSASAREKSKP